MHFQKKNTPGRKILVKGNRRSKVCKMQIFVEGVCLRVCFTIVLGYIMKTFHNKMFKNVKKVCIAYATKKIGRGSEHTVLQKRNSDGQRVHEKMLHIAT